jgi:Polyketide cyclase / dehydrase and lipid transport
MDLIKVAVSAPSTASPAAIFTLLKDGSTWPHWSSFDAFELERPGREETYGLGAIRVFITKISRAREEVVELVENQKLSYILLSGLPFRAYRAEVTLAPQANGGTIIHWRSQFYVRHWGTGWFWRRFMTYVLRDIATKLASAAARQ